MRNLSVIIIVVFFFSCGQKQRVEEKSPEGKAISSFLNYCEKAQACRNDSDFDGDSKADDIVLDFTGGAHCCYKLSMKLSSEKKMHEFPFYMDGHYERGVDDSYPWHFGVEDYDNDGLPEIFMEISTYNSDIDSVAYPSYNIFSNYILIEFENGKLQVKDMAPFENPWQFCHSRKLKRAGDLFPIKVKMERDSLYGYYDGSGQMIIAPQYKTAGSFSCGRAFVQTCLSNWEIIDRQGRRIAYAPSSWRIGYLLPNTFREDLVTIYSEEVNEDNSGHNSGYLFIDTNGKPISRLFNDVRVFSDGLIAAQKEEDGLWGYLDKHLKWKIPPRFTSAYDFERDSAYVGVDGKIALKIINKKGEFLKTGLE